TWHLAADAPLTSDIVSLASPMSGWVRSTKSAAALGEDMAAAIAASLGPPGQVATLIVPADCQWDNATAVGNGARVAKRAKVSGAAIDGAAKRLRSAKRAVILLGGEALRERGLSAAARVAAASGARLMPENFTARIGRGAGAPPAIRLPYFPDQALDALAGTEIVILAGAKEPVSFFGYPGVPSLLIPEGSSLEVHARVE